jgi:hypothetical protein
MSSVVERPDHVVCIRHSHSDQKNTTWCGRPCPYEWTFVNIDHAVYNARNEGYLMVCMKCVEAALACLRPEEQSKVVL